MKPDDFTMASATKKFRKGGEFNGSYSRGQGSGGYPAQPIQSLLQTIDGGPPQSVMDVGRLDTLRGIVQNRVTDLK